jgi:histidine kinase
MTKISYKEVIFQLVLHALVFIFFSFDRNHPQIELSQVVFFINYSIAAFSINYFLLPHFFYKKKLVSFLVYLVLTIAAVIFIEEMILERIFFPGTKRAESFGGVFYCLLDVLPIITILSGFKFAWDAVSKQREVDVLKDAVKESELQFLKSQINPHFLFNNLNNLYSYAIENSPKTPEIILELSGVLRYMLYECKEKYVPLAKEVAQLENFINLNEMQIEERGQVNFSSKNIRSDFQIAPLILIVFIENAFKHSTASQSDKIIIDVELKLSDSGFLDFICKNTFQPMSNTDSLLHGIGLENVKKRLHLLYPEAHKLVIKNNKSLYEVYLSIDLNKIA